MKSYRQLRENSWLLLLMLTAVAFMSAGCSSSSVGSSTAVNPLGAYQEAEKEVGVPTDGTVTNPGSIDSPIITTPTDGSGSIDGHTNAPLLDNMHPGWQQSSCLSCHDDTSRNPDHNYTDSSMCYLCHGTNGLPGFADNIPPIISSVVTTPQDNSVKINWITDEDCLSRMVLRTTGGDRMEFPVSVSYTTRHSYDVSGLQPETTYSFELICTDKQGNKTTTSSFGVLTFTTLEDQPDPTSISGPGDTEIDYFFTGIDIAEDGPFKATIKFTVQSPSTVFAYFIYADDNTLADQVNLNDLAGGDPITSFDGFVTGLDADTDYKCYLEATDSDGVEHESQIYTFKTDSFEG